MAELHELRRLEERLLVSYRPAVKGGGDSLCSSVWRKGSAGWQMLFHQGTSVRDDRP